MSTELQSGSSDPDTNFLLKVAIDRCKKFNVPKDNIERAVKKGQGSDGAGYEDITYEGYGPNGVAIFVEARLTMLRGLLVMFEVILINVTDLLGLMAHLSLSLKEKLFLKFQQRE